VPSVQQIAKHLRNFIQTLPTDTLLTKSFNPIFMRLLDLFYVQMMEDRKVYYAHRKECEDNAKVVSIIIDTMDQKKTAIPFNLEEDERMKFRLIGVLIHRSPIRR